MQVKGMEMAGYDPRSLKSMGLSYAVGTRGACHNRSPGYSPDTSDQVDRLVGGEERGPIIVDLEDKAAVFDSMVLCKFIRGIFEDFYDEGSQLMAATTGLDITPGFLAEAGASRILLAVTHAGVIRAMDVASAAGFTNLSMADGAAFL